MTTAVHNSASQLRYDMTLDDLVEFQVHYQLFSESTRLQREKNYRMLSIVAGLVYVLFGFMLCAMMPTVLSLWFPPVLGVAVGGLVYWSCRKRKRRMPKWMRRRIRNAYASRDNKTTLCEHLLEARADGLYERTPYSESRCAWGALELIESGDGHTYMFIGAAKAFVIPHKRITDGSLPDFLRAVKGFYQPDQRLEPGLRGSGSELQ